MFVTKKTFEKEERYTQLKFQELNEKYWELLIKHQRLLDHLGLDEKTLPQETKLVKRGKSK